MKQIGNAGIIRVELNHINKGTSRILKDTIAVFRDVVSYLTHAACDHLEEVLPLSSFDETTFMDGLVHRTKNNPSPAYPEFDVLFRRLPSYIRRAANHAACGQVRSHESNCDHYYAWRDDLVKRRHHVRKMEPGFSYTPNVFPTVYRDQSYSLEDNTISIKVWKNNSWQWIKVSAPARDLKCLAAAAAHGKVMNPKLVYAYRKYYLEFPVQYKTSGFSKTPLYEQRVLGTDLGLNNGAVCSSVDAYGSIHGRHFSPFKEEMARIDHIIGLIRKKSHTSGKGQSLSSLYTKLQGLKEDYCRRLARWIVDTAVSERVYGIVLEHLDKMKGHGRLSARIHNWCMAKIRDYIRGMAFREGIRVFIINPKGTSMYAFDGSGLIVRDKKNFSKCTFVSGKQYNCDLSASYNIGARYFLRTIKKSIPATEWSQAVAKVPGLAKRTTWTLDTLKQAASA